MLRLRHHINKHLTFTQTFNAKMKYGDEICPSAKNLNVISRNISIKMLKTDEIQFPPSLFVNSSYPHISDKWVNVQMK